jgi:hypothetical protein
VGFEFGEGGKGERPQDPDLNQLTELDLGGCASFGAARVQELVEARTVNGELCSFEEADCVFPLYRPKAIGCQIIPLTVEVEGGE